MFLSPEFAILHFKKRGGGGFVPKTQQAFSVQVACEHL